VRFTAITGRGKLTVSAAAAADASGLSRSSDVIVMATARSSRQVSQVSAEEDDAVAATNRSS